MRAESYVLRVDRGELLGQLMLMFSSSKADDRLRLTVRDGILELFKFDAGLMCSTRSLVAWAGLEEQPGPDPVGQQFVLSNMHRATRFLKQLGKGEISLSWEAGRGLLQITQGSSSARLPLSGADDYPAGQVFPAQYVEVERERLLQILDHVGVSIGVDTLSTALQGMLIGRPKEGAEDAEGADEIEEAEGLPRVCFASTDGHRLSVWHEPMAADWLPKDIIVSREGIRLLRKMLTSNTSVDQVHMAVVDNHLAARIGSQEIYVGLIDAAYPAFEKLIPDRGSIQGQLTVGAQLLMDTLRRVSLFSDVRVRGVRMHCQPAGDERICLSSLSLGEMPASGMAEDGLDAVYEGKEMTLGFNAAYMMDILKCMVATWPSCTVCLAITGASTPMLLTIDGVGEYLYLLMPLHLDDEQED